MNLTIYVKKADLIRKLKANLAKHEKEYKKAIKGWHRKVGQAALKLAAAAKKGTLKNMNEVRALNGLHKPQDMRDHYKKTISMISHAQDESIKIDEVDFNRFMEDDWDWKLEWASSNTGYMGR